MHPPFFSKSLLFLFKLSLFLSNSSLPFLYVSFKYIPTHESHIVRCSALIVQSGANLFIFYKGESHSSFTIRFCKQEVRAQQPFKGPNYEQLCNQLLKLIYVFILFIWTKLCLLDDHDKYFPKIEICFITMLHQFDYSHSIN